jgi:hypothetical protein
MSQHVPNKVSRTGSDDGVVQLVLSGFCPSSVVWHSEHSTAYQKVVSFLSLNGKVGRYPSPLDKVQELCNIEHKLLGEIHMLLPLLLHLASSQICFSSLAVTKEISVLCWIKCKSVIGFKFTLSFQLLQNKAIEV